MIMQNYDHHCKWINNCVGKGNLPAFTGFLICALADLFIGFLVGPYLTKQHGEVYYAHYVAQFMVVCFCAGMIVVIAPIAFLQVTNAINATTTSDRFSKKSLQSLNTSVFRDSFMNDTFED